MNVKAERPSIDTVFFDAAGTLIRVRGSVGETYLAQARRFGFCGDGQEDLRERIGRAFKAAFRRREPLNCRGEPEDRLGEIEKDWWREVVRESFEPFGPFPRFEEFFREVYRFFGTAEAWEAEPGTHEVLPQLKDRGLRLSVVSNFDSRLQGVLSGLGLRHFFDTLTVSSTASAAKPDPAIFRVALEVAGARSESALHVGDDLEQDFQAARAAGLDALLYDPRGRYPAVPAEFRITSLKELLEILP